jgi:ComF family protein
MTKAKLSTVLGKIHKFALDILFPIKCISCGREETWLCRDCFANLKVLNDHVCGVCERMITPDGRTCHKCKKTNALDGLVVAASYRNSLIASLVHLYKYRFAFQLSQLLGDLMIKAIQQTDIPLAEIIIPVPLHPRRLRWRGFNQAAFLAKHISLNLLPGTEIPIEEKILIRKKYTSPQMKVGNYNQRKENIKGAFIIDDSEKIRKKSILLIDDIATTGSTIFECARILKENGAKEIYAAVIARQEIKKL